MTDSTDSSLNQMQNLNDDVLSLFILGTHHLNRSVILTVQSVFYR